MLGRHPVGRDAVAVEHRPQVMVLAPQAVQAVLGGEAPALPAVVELDRLAAAHAAAEVLVGLQQQRVKPALGQVQRRRQPGQPAAHHDHGLIRR